MQERANPGVAFSPMSTVAALSVMALILFVGYQAAHAFVPVTAVRTQDAPAKQADPTDLAALAASTSDPIEATSAGALAEIVGAYAGLQAGGTYNPQTASAIASTIGSTLSAPISYHTFSSGDIQTDPDTSYEAMMRYRAELQTSLQPLLSNKDSEFELFGQYVDTKDTSYLDKLSAEAANYEAAASSTAQLTVPVDAVSYQLGILNATEEFAATLRAMVSHANDPLASAMLLSNYTKAESDMLGAFNALVSYEKSKTQ